MTAVFLHKDGTEGARMIYDAFKLEGIQLVGVKGEEAVALAWCSVAGTWVVYGEKSYESVRIEP